MRSRETWPHLEAANSNSASPSDFLSTLQETVSPGLLASLPFSRMRGASRQDVAQDEWTQTLNTARRRRDEKTGAVGQAMGRQQAGSRTGDGSATGGQLDRRWVGNRVQQQAGSQAGGVRQQTGNWITGQRLGKQEHKLAPAGRRSPA